jgi:hypothetical protein
VKKAIAEVLVLKSSTAEFRRRDFGQTKMRKEGSEKLARGAQSDVANYPSAPLLIGGRRSGASSLSLRLAGGAVARGGGGGGEGGGGV